MSGKLGLVPGHWKGDLLFGSHNSQIATLVERHSRYVMLVRVKSKDTKSVIDALIKQAHKLPRELYQSLTWDRGKEMADQQGGIQIQRSFSTLEGRRSQQWTRRSLSY